MVLLIVDRSLQIVERLANLLQEAGMGMTIYKTTTYTEAAGVVEKASLRIIILDRHLPNGQSIRLLELAKEKKTGIAVIMLTSKPEPGVIAQYRLSGADYVLDKYHEFEKLPGIVKNIIGQ